MNVLVTGGFGFIGSHLVEQLLRRRDAHVVVVDNLSNTVLKPAEITAELTRNASGTLEVVMQDIVKYQPHKQVRFDRIYHLASVVGPAAVLNHSGRITSSIVRDAYRIIQLAQQHEARLVFVSTSEVYGGGRDGYCQEQTPCVFRGAASARKEYAAAKLACEIGIQNLCESGQLDAVIIRPFNVAGRRQQGRGGFVLPRFVGQAMLGRPLTVFGDGSQVRAFTDARDVAAGMILIDKAGPSGQVYNVGNVANRVTITALADCVLDMIGSAVGKRLLDPRTLYGPGYAEAADKFPDASHLEQLGWKPEYKLEQTVRDVADWLGSQPRGRIEQLAGLDPSPPPGCNKGHGQVTQYAYQDGERIPLC